MGSRLKTLMVAAVAAGAGAGLALVTIPLTGQTSSQTPPRLAGGSVSLRR